MNNGWSAYKNLCSFVLMSILTRTEEHKNKNKRVTEWSAHKKICPFVLLSEKRKHPQIQRKKNASKALVELEDYP